MTEMSDFQKNFLANSGHVRVFTQKEFDEALTMAKAEIMAIAIETSRTAVMIEREACADIARDAGHADLAEKILDRIPSQRQ